MTLPLDHTLNVSIRRLPVTGSDLFGREAKQEEEKTARAPGSSGCITRRWRSQNAPSLVERPLPKSGLVAFHMPPLP
jgi:hypothetical protein